MYGGWPSLTACCAPVGWTAGPIADVHLSWLRKSAKRDNTRRRVINWTHYCRRVLFSTTYVNCSFYPYTSILVYERASCLRFALVSVLSPLLSSLSVSILLRFLLHSVPKSIYVVYTRSNNTRHESPEDQVDVLRALLFSRRPDCSCRSILWRELLWR